jgi:hypothetical protein
MLARFAPARSARWRLVRVGMIGKLLVSFCQDDRRNIADPSRIDLSSPSTRFAFMIALTA